MHLQANFINIENKNNLGIKPYIAHQLFLILCQSSPGILKQMEKNVAFLNLYVLIRK